MGKTSNGGIGSGARGHQGNISQGGVDAKVDELTKKIANENTGYDASKFSYEDSRAKYHTYLLNLEHSEGGSKAKFLKNVLGYHKGDSEKLHKAIGEAINGKVPDTIKITEFGVKYNFKVKLEGKDGKFHAANVTVVIQNDNGKITWRIITLTPDKKDK